MPTDGYFTIKDLSDQYGVSFRTLRFYEERELLKPLRVGRSRCYTTKDKIRLALIIKGKELGFSLSEIWRLISAAETVSEPATIGAIMSREAIVRQLGALEDKRNAISEALLVLEGALAARRRREQRD